jgi:hypothetical protein|eukprot:COSAG01_NODE_2687_length_7249_cov_105.374406_6_plen_115_part_00
MISRHDDLLCRDDNNAGDEGGDKTISTLLPCLFALRTLHPDLAGERVLAFDSVVSFGFGMDGLRFESSLGEPITPGVPVRQVFGPADDLSAWPAVHSEPGRLPGVCMAGEAAGR